MREFYSEHPGLVCSLAIDQHIVISVSRRTDRYISVRYYRHEHEETVDRISHPIVRECLRLLDCKSGIDITSSSECPPNSGLGSSSAFTVGLLHALHLFRGDSTTAEQLAGEACHIEIDLLGAPIGRQDQYIVAYGGCRSLAFLPSDVVRVQPMPCSTATLTKLESHLMLFLTGQTRTSNIMQDQRNRITSNTSSLIRLAELAGKIIAVLSSNGDVADVGPLLHEGWMIKRCLARGITDARIDNWYFRASRAGASGGKILGSGGGGFLLLFVEPQYHTAVKNELADLTPWPFSFCAEGTRVLYSSASEQRESSAIEMMRADSDTTRC